MLWEKVQYFSGRKKTFLIRRKTRMTDKNLDKLWIWTRLSLSENCVHVYWNHCERKSRRFEVFVLSSCVQLAQYFILLKVQLWDWRAENDCSLGLTECFTFFTYNALENWRTEELHLKSWFFQEFVLLDFHQSAFFANLTFSEPASK